MKQSTSKKNRDNTAFLYLRLSRDDNLDGESYSIGNQKKLKELERQKTEQENTEIVEAVRGMDISLSDLAAFMKTVRPASGQVGPKSGERKEGGEE